MFREAFFANAPVVDHVEVIHPAAGKVRVYMMTAGEKDEFDKAIRKSDWRHFRARLVVMTVRDEEGRPIFTEADLPALSARPLTDIEPMVDAAIGINRMNEQVQEYLQKNS
jgi:hypothetical protein